MIFDRDSVLSLPDEKLSAECVFDFFKATGNGGQKRNKTSSAVRVKHIPSGLTATDCCAREQSRNRHNALLKLRMLIALEYRETPAVPPARMECSANHSDYPLWCAHILDVLAQQEWDLKAAAVILGRSVTSLLKIILKDTDLHRKVNYERQKLDKPALKLK